jgi:hypothetical protein
MTMRRAAGIVAGSLVMAGAVVAWARHRGEPSATPISPGGTATPVVVELFSSEGCSSCPPADEYLARLDREQSVGGVAVVALEEHVDYWDGLGWADPFGQPAFGTRQRGYAAVLPDRRVYTPEIVIDGHAVVENGHEDEAARDMRASAAARRARIDLARSADRWVVDARDVPPAPPGDRNEVWLALTESGLESRVERGENAGRRLAHAPIVRVLRALGTVSGDTFHAETSIEARSSWRPRALRVVVFVQQAVGRGIVGAGAASL